MELKVHIEHDPRFRGTAVYFYGKDKKGDFVIEPVDLIVRHYELGETCDKPTLIFNGFDGEAFLQSLVEALVKIGFKPNELEAANKETSATKYHLEDMRSLVFKGIVPPIKKLEI